MKTNHITLPNGTIVHRDQISVVVVSRETKVPMNDSVTIPPRVIVTMGYKTIVIKARSYGQAVQWHDAIRRAVRAKNTVGLVHRFWIWFTTLDDTKYPRGDQS